MPYFALNVQTYLKPLFQKFLMLKLILIQYKRSLKVMKVISTLKTLWLMEVNKYCLKMKENKDFSSTGPRQQLFQPQPQQLTQWPRLWQPSSVRQAILPTQAVENNGWNQKVSKSFNMQTRIKVFVFNLPNYYFI